MTILLDSEKEDLVTKHSLLGSKLQQSLQSNHLEGQNISSTHRARFIEWYLQVITALGLCDATYFLAIDIIDLFLLYSHQLGFTYDKDDLYLIGITAIHIAIKKEEILKYPMEIITQDLGKDRFSKDQILVMEKEIL